VSSQPGGSVVWRYHGAEAIAFKRDRVVAVAGIATVQGRDLGRRIRYSRCSATADDCIMFLSDGRRFRCPGTTQAIAGVHIGGDVVENKRCALIRPR
jgi:hypothetical protein